MAWPLLIEVLVDGRFLIARLMVSNRGLTRIELLVVLALIATLATIGLASGY